MRRAVASRSLPWWLVVLCSLGAVAVFLMFEVLDLDGSDLHKCIFQPPISSQPMLAESEGAMRQGAFVVSDALGVLQQRPVVLYFFTVSAPPTLCKRLTSTRPRGSIHRVSAPPPPAIDDSHPGPLAARSDGPRHVQIA
jgi:hypothetical protein